MAFKDLTLHHGFGRMALLGLLCLALGACNDGTRKPVNGAQAGKDGNYGHQVWHLQVDTLHFRIETGRLFALDNPQKGTLSFQDSLVVVVRNTNGRQLAKLKAQEANSVPPYDLTRIRDFLWICNDNAEIEGSDLFWHVHGPKAITMEGEIQIINDKGLVMGEDLQGDLLLQNYEVAHVGSVLLWDDVAGGREGHLSGQ